MSSLIIILAVSPFNFWQRWPSLFVLAVTIYLQELNGESAKIIMTTFAFCYVSYFLYGPLPQEFAVVAWRKISSLCPAKKIFF